MDSQEILNLLKFGEHINLECKKAESKLPNSVWETYSSFANTDGGIILFGVEEHIKETEQDKRFSFVSIYNPEQRLKDFWNTVNSEKVSSNILIDANVGSDISLDMIDLKNETDRQIYEYICTNGFITVHQILDITKITTQQGASVALNRLIRADLVVKRRQGRQFIYLKKQ